MKSDILFPVYKNGCSIKEYQTRFTQENNVKNSISHAFLMNLYFGYFTRKNGLILVHLSA